MCPAAPVAKWCMTTKPDGGHGEEMLDLMRLHDLFAVDTLFKPAKKRWKAEGRKRLCNATYLQKDIHHTKTNEARLYLCNEQMEVNDAKCES